MPDQASDVNDVLLSGMEAEDNKNTEDNGNGRQSGVDEGAPEPEPSGTGEAAEKSEDGIDVDLTALSSIMVYSEVYNMMVTPESYMGKTIKMDGIFSLYHDDSTGKDYYACIITDATACCSQGIEFVPTDDYVYPDDYPEQGGEISVVGIFDLYEEGESKYCTLRNARLV